jgi:hypothetical protein
MWIVTARHCIDEARAYGQEFFIRVSGRESSIDVATNVDDWHVSCRADVAVALWVSPADAKITAVPLDQFINADYKYTGASDLPVAEELASMGGQAVLVGHEIAFVGLFSQHAGTQKNLPIARFGAVSRRPAEPIQLRRPDGTVESVEGYLVESQSWGGDSGSPAFWYYPVANVRSCQTRNRKAGTAQIEDVRGLHRTFPSPWKRASSAYLAWYLRT